MSIALCDFEFIDCGNRGPSPCRLPADHDGPHICAWCWYEPDPPDYAP